MTERERLIDMLAHIGNMRIMRHGLGECADYMLANGVIVPPCPITHDSIFAIVDLYNRKKIVGQTIAKYDIDCIIIGFSGKPIYRCCNASNEWMDFEGDEIGKTVFLTREEAEKALAERSNDGKS